MNDFSSIHGISYSFSDFHSIKLFRTINNKSNLRKGKWQGINEAIYNSSSIIISLYSTMV